MRRPPRVLVVDDEGGVVHTTCTILNRRGFYAEGASDGGEAVARVREHHFDLVLMDIRMPGTDGVTALREIRKLPDPPVVMLMTAFSTTSVLQEAMEAGARDVLLKPVDFKTVIELVAAVPTRQSVCVVSSAAPESAEAVAVLLRLHGRSARVAPGLSEALSTLHQHPTADVLLVDQASGPATPEALEALGALKHRPSLVPYALGQDAGPEVLTFTLAEPSPLLAALDQLAATRAT